MNILYASILKSRLKTQNIERNNTNTTKALDGVTYPSKVGTRIFVPILNKAVLALANL